MAIKYQDSNLLVTYLQIFLQKYFNTTVKKITPRKKSSPSYYIITSTDELRVTGSYNPQTYTAISLYMAYNFPNEGFPRKWRETSKESWSVEDYIYKGNEEELKNIISHNVELFIKNREIITIPDRVISYLLNRVVTPQSSPEEIVKVKKLVFTNVSRFNVLSYDEALMEKVRSIQQKFINDHTSGRVVDLPPQFEGFKVTGYVDPWTEIVIKGGFESDNE